MSRTNRRSSHEKCIDCRSRKQEAGGVQTVVKGTCEAILEVYFRREQRT